MITYLAFADQRSIARQTQLGEDYIAAAPIPAGATAGLTGSSAARQQQMSTIDDWMPLVVTITLALIALLVGLVFRRSSRRSSCSAPWRSPTWSIST